MKLITQEIVKIQRTLSVPLEQGLPDKNGLYAIWGCSGNGPLIAEVSSGAWRSLTSTNYPSGTINSVDGKFHLLHSNKDEVHNWNLGWYWIHLTKIEGL